MAFHLVNFVNFLTRIGYRWGNLYKFGDETRLENHFGFEKRHWIQTAHILRTFMKPKKKQWRLPEATSMAFRFVNFVNFLTRIGYQWAVLWSRFNFDPALAPVRLPAPALAPSSGKQYFCNTNLSKKCSFEN